VTSAKMAFRSIQLVRSIDPLLRFTEKVIESGIKLETWVRARFCAEGALLLYNTGWRDDAYRYATVADHLFKEALKLPASIRSSEIRNMQWYNQRLLAKLHGEKRGFEYGKREFEEFEKEFKANKHLFAGTMSSKTEHYFNFLKAQEALKEILEPHE